MPLEVFRAPPSPPRAASRRAPRLLICVPAFGCLNSTTFENSLVADLLPELHARGVTCRIEFIGNESLIERARNTLAAKFLNTWTDCDYMLFVDADIGFRAANVLRLLAFLEKEDEDIACGVYSKKHVNWAQVEAKCASGASEPVHQQGLDFNINAHGADGVVRVRSDGFARVLEGATGFMMIRRRALEKMYAAYREELWVRNDVPGQVSDVPEYVAVFACSICPETRRFLSEDYAFCRRWQKLGGHVYIDMAMPLTHEGGYMWQGDLRSRLADAAEEPRAG